MVATTLVYRSNVPAPAPELYNWHARDGAFTRLAPPWRDVQVQSASGTINPGDSRVLKLSAGPLPVTWSLVHEAGSSDFGFVDQQRSGPFRAWRHEHRFLPDGPDHSTLEDRITYELPLNPITGPIAGRRLNAELQQLFRFRHQRTMTDLNRHAGSGLSPLRIAVTGSSGLVGSQLVAFLRTGGHQVSRLVRGSVRANDEISWNPATGAIDKDALEGFDAVVHLAGESIASGRWTARRKQEILNSRLQGTRLLSETLASLKNPPGVLVSASGIGYYGDGGNAILTEHAPKGHGFLADVCEVWEHATSPAAEAGIRVVNARFGVVVSAGGGLLERVGRLFRLGAGGQLGRGTQYMSWIALDDLLGVLLEAIANPELSGPVNAVSPNPVTNAEFTRTMATVLKRPAVFRVPAPVLRLTAGELADELLLFSQLAQPARLGQIGFRFDYPTLESALRHELGRSDAAPATRAAAMVSSPSTALNPGNGD